MMGEKWPETCRAVMIITIPKSCISLVTFKVFVCNDARSYEYKKTERQCTCKRNIEAGLHNLLLQCKSISITYSGCMSIPSYSACNPHAPVMYFHMLPGWLYQTFISSHKRRDFQERLLNIKYVF